MDLLWMILVFLVCARAQNVTEVREKLGQNITEVRLKLGQNVTLKCSGDNSNTYWYMEIYHSQVQGFIGRSFSSSDSQYYVLTVRPKYSAFGNSLMIINITADDCRLYFCGRKINNSVHFMDTFRLVSAMTPSTNDSGLNGASVWQTDLIRTVSLGLNAFLTLGTVSLLCLLLRLKKKKKNVSCTDGLILYENTQSLRTAKVNQRLTLRLSASHCHSRHCLLSRFYYFLFSWLRWDGSCCSLLLQHLDFFTAGTTSATNSPAVPHADEADFIE